MRIIPVLVVGLLAISIIAMGVVTPVEHVRAIIVYNDKVQDSDIKALNAHGVAVDSRLDMIDGVSVELSQSVFDKIDYGTRHGQAGYDRIKFIELDQQVHALGSAAVNSKSKPGSTPTLSPSPTVAPVPQVTPWGITDVKAPEAWTRTTGAGVKVAVIDSGIDYTHPDLAGKVIDGHSFVSYTASYMDDYGHGTHVAGTIAALNNNIGVVGVAPGASLYAVKVLDSSGNGYMSDVIKGIQWSVANGAQVISMSLGSSSDSKALHKAVDAAYNSGVVVVAAAGNTYGCAVTYPAAYSSVIAVNAVDSNNSIAPFSSIGPQVGLAAPGVDVYSTYLGGYVYDSGTSMACPHVSGVVALMLATPPGAYDKNSNGKWDPAEVRQKLDDTAHDLGVPGRDQYYGYGLVDAANATI